MKLIGQPRIELLFKQTNLIIPCEKAENRAIQRLLDSLGTLDLSKDYVVEIKPKKQRRSLNANAYYYKLCGEISYKKGYKLAEYHNRNLAELGIPWLDREGQKHWILQKDDDWWLRQTEIHFCPTDRTEDRNGTAYRWFYLLLPSHLMDTREMSLLIDGVVQDAKGLGIETLTPAELERMKAAWKGGG